MKLISTVFFVLGLIGLGFSVAASIVMLLTVLAVLAINYLTKGTPDTTKLFVMIGMTVLSMIFSVGLIAFGDYIGSRR